jgi:hypothetical protein
MTQPKRPISRSSTLIEFAPLILDLEPEVKEEPKQKRGRAKWLMMVVGIAIVLGTLGYLGLKSSNTEGQKKILAPNTSESGKIPDPIVTSEEKKRIFTYGITNAKLTLENIDGQDVLKVSIKDKAGEGITWVYEWTINDIPSGKGDSIKGFKRGDNVIVKISPFDGEKYGRSKVLTTTINNTAPRVIEDKTATFDGKQMTYQVKAADADGDNLTYSLSEAPQGMLIDSKSGIISWSNIPENQQEFGMKVKIADGHGGELVYPVTVNLPKPVKENVTAQK